MKYICTHFQWLPKGHLNWHKIIYFCVWACSAYFPLFSKYLLINVQVVIAHNIAADVCFLATDYYARGLFQFVVVVEVLQNWTSGHGRIKADAKQYLCLYSFASTYIHLQVVHTCYLMLLMQLQSSQMFFDDRVHQCMLYIACYVFKNL